MLKALPLFLAIEACGTITEGEIARDTFRYVFTDFEHFADCRITGAVWESRAAFKSGIPCAFGTGD